MENRAGILLMIASMAGFAIEDMLIKQVAAALPVAQILLILGIGGMIAFALLAKRQGLRLWSPALLTRPVMLRNLAEAVGTISFVSAIALTPLASASAILQALPLAVTLGAAVFLGAPVGWRRWTAICAGLVGVLMVVRPGLEGFRPASLLAVLAVVAFAARDLATWVTPRSVTSLQLSTYGFAVLVPVSAALLALGPAPAPVDGLNALRLGAALVVGVGAYYAIVEAMRLGDIAVVTPFRYSRLVFAMALGVVVFGERPDGWTLAGAGVIIASGLYTLARERALYRRAAGRHTLPGLTSTASDGRKSP